MKMGLNMPVVRENQVDAGAWNTSFERLGGFLTQFVAIID